MKSTSGTLKGVGDYAAQNLVPQRSENGSAKVGETRHDIRNINIEAKMTRSFTGNLLPMNGLTKTNGEIVNLGYMTLTTKKNKLNYE